jgi:TetR/AcrR family transcriptional repressor of nem operon
LIQATGVSRYGLYGEFGDKNGRFLAALEHDQAHVVGPILDIVEQPDAGLTVLRAYFGMLSEFSRQPDSKLGCLVFNSITEMRLHDDVTTRKILEVCERLATGIRRMIANAAIQGGLPPDFDVRREADFLFDILRALPILARSGADAAAIDNVISVALSSLE